MNLHEIAGDANGTGLHIGVAASSFNAVVSDALVSGALEALESMDVDRVTVVRVPGALEVPLTAMRLAEMGCDAVVAVGAVIKGETDHYEHVSMQAAAGVKDVSLRTGIPVTNAILTVTDLSQATERSRPGPANKGFEAAEAAVRTAQALSQLRSD